MCRSTLDPYEDAQNVDESCAWKILNVFTLADNMPMDCDQWPEKLIKNSGYDLLSLDEKYKLLVSSPTAKFPYPCPMCTFKTRNKNTLRDHILRLHIDECAYSCEICADEFKVKADLTQHLKTEHTTKKCFICGIVFKYHRSFVGHMKRKHANHPYQCAKCNHYSESLAALKKHEKWHAKMKKRSVVTCPKCGKQVRDYNVLTHMFKHNDMMSNMCPICGKRVQKPSAMQVHLLTHSGIKPYVCDMCGKKFSQKVWLLKHWTRQHPGPQPFVPTISLKEIVTDFLETYKHVKQEIN
nr:zinc finger protein 676-like [Megalopta genalis]